LDVISTDGKEASVLGFGSVWVPETFDNRFQIETLHSFMLVALKLNGLSKKTQ